MDMTSLLIDVPDVGAVSGLWQAPPRPRAALALAHGAGAGMAHRSMVAIADGLAELGVGTLRYQFPYMEKGGKRPDAPAVAQATVRAAAAVARERAAGAPLFAGGRSFGGRMTSQAQAAEPLADVRGLIFFAFPLHLAGKPAVTRAEHLAEIKIPMLFLQGSKDALAELDLLQQTVAGLKDRATLELIPDADHAFHVPKKSGRSDAEVLAAALEAAVRWMGAAPGAPASH
ncbi:MAG TPA: alpha/beta family hydrolase [Caulobacteraceae bacterium]|jgi:predicted alpha/beta-hydrolase family hydrolase|nr:alpha/beta family hydrolase [Caulobacteraceae bacterium]